MRNKRYREFLNKNILLILLQIITLALFSLNTIAQNQQNVAGYATLIQQADQAFATKDYASALMLYEKARQARPELTYSTTKISEINTVLDANPDSRSQLFENIIVKAENFYAQKNFPGAKTEYHKALAIDPSAQFPKDRLAQISTVYTDPADLAYFDEAVANGDRSLSASEFDKAILFYETAIAVKPGAKVAKEKITIARKLQSEYKIKTDQAAKIIVGADKLLLAEKRLEAKAEFQKVLDLTPDNQYAKLKIQEINNFETDKKALQDNYDKIIDQADQFYINRDFANARIKYMEAQKVKPAARYPKEMLEKTKSGESVLQSDQQRYDAAIASADNLLNTNEYEAALIGYKSALEIKPLETYPKTKITDIEKLISDRVSRKDAFEIAIKNGDNSFAERKYDPALNYYRNALSLVPGEKYPAQKIEEITTILGQQKSVDDTYKKAIADADLLFKQNKYTEAISTYTKALALKPGENYPQQQINESQAKLDLVKNEEEQYSNAIADGDKSFAEQKYDKALAAYKLALTLKPAEKYPKDKYEETNKLLAKNKADSDKYELAISNGEKELVAGNYKLALSAFQDASKIKPAEQYPQDKITEINSQLEMVQKTNEQYTATISAADHLLIDKDYEQALLSYNKAAELKKNEKYPKDQIIKINKILGDLLSADQNYTQAISTGDANFNNQKYTESIISYQKAAAVKPAESYPISQIEKINGLIAKQKQLDADYTSAVASADKQFSLKKYDEAIADYRRALTLKSSEKYPADKITEAEKLLANLKILQESFEKAIAEGDKYLADKEFASSLASFKNASSLKPTASYPKQKISEIQDILDKDKAEGQRYQEALTQADLFFTQKNLTESLASYQKALTIKSAEKYPQDQIIIINQLIAEQKKLDEDYSKLISDADLKLKAIQYDEARVLFNKASVLKPAEKLPKDKISEIDLILSDIKTKDQNYSKAISDGDALLTEKKFTEAITSYNTALAIKPAESYPKTQLDKIISLIAEQKKLDEDYLGILTTADNKFDSKTYTEAITEYRKAITLKPNEKYPVDRINEAENLIAEIKAKQETYGKSVADGDKKLAAKEYENALNSFKTANSAKPSETYAILKISEIEGIIAKLKAENDSYKEAITLADKFYTAEKYREALEPYQRATTVKPAEKYPMDQIGRINQLLAEQKKLEDEYQKLIAQAEMLLTAQKYDEARGIYSNAGKLKSSERLPADKIAEIDGILAAIKQKDENYTKAINTASELYASKNLTAAIESYEEAISIKPSEKYPHERITAIKAELKAIDDNYLKALTLGDSKLASKNLMEALNAYQNALEIKPEEVYPKSKIAEINSTLSAQKEEQEKLYTSFISDGDKLFETKDYSGSKSAFTKATGIKPSESYPKQRITEIDKIVDEIELARKVEYTKALGEADKLFNTKVFDQAIDAYETASKINPGDSYPSIQIAKVRKYMTDHAIQDLYSQKFTISEGNEKKFTFSAIEPRLRKNNYILLTAHSIGKTAPKVYLNYGKDNLKNGAIVIRSLTKTEISDFVIRISVQDKWYREDNNWISLFVETGEIEIIKVQIAAGD